MPQENVDAVFDIQDVRDAGDDVVALIHHQRQWARHTGIVTELPPYAQVFTLRDGKLVRWRTSRSRSLPSKTWGCRNRPRSAPRDYPFSAW